jgi:hypothetical protein
LADDTITFLVQVELPIYCFLSEAVEWAAVGRVPQVQWDVDSKSDEPVEHRFYWREMPDNFEPNFVYPWFDRGEFDYLGIQIVEDYFFAAQKCYGEFVHDLPSRIAEFESKEDLLYEDEDGKTRNVHQGLAGDYRQRLEELLPLQEIVDRTESSFWRFYEIAWAKLFQLLAAGEIECSGVDLERWERLCEDDKYEEAGQFQKLDPALIPLVFNWRQNRLEAGDLKWASLRIKTADVIKHRASLLRLGQVASVERLGAGFVLKHSESAPARRRRGRPQEVDWGELKLHLGGLIENGTLPQTKESCIYSLIAFSEKSLGKSPSRSSVQRNLDHELRLIYGPKL